MNSNSSALYIPIYLRTSLFTSVTVVQKLGRLSMANKACGSCDFPLDVSFTCVDVYVTDQNHTFRCNNTDLQTVTMKNVLRSSVHEQYESGYMDANHNLTGWQGYTTKDANGVCLNNKH